jgi:hypothetical protein
MAGIPRYPGHFVLRKKAFETSAWGVESERLGADIKTCWDSFCAGAWAPVSSKAHGQSHKSFLRRPFFKKAASLPTHSPRRAG